MLSATRVRWANLFCILCYFQLASLPSTAQSSNAATSPQRPTVRSAPSISPQRTLLNTYCVTCHSDRLHTAGLSLEHISVDSVAPNAQTWEKVLNKLGTGAMPPPKMPHPAPAASKSFQTWLETMLDQAAKENPNPGRVGVHRLNRAEYANAVRDLLGLEIDAKSLLLADDADRQGFENVAGVLSVSPALLERYMSAARKISRLAVGDPTIVPVFETFDVPRTLVQEGQMGEDLPFGSRGGLAIHYYFPVDGEYAVRIRLRRQLYDYIIGMGKPHELEVRVDGERVKLFTVGGAAKGKPAPASFAGNIAGDPEWELYMHDADAGLETRFPVKAGQRIVAVDFIDPPAEPEGLLQPPENGFGAGVNEWYDGNPAVGSVAIGGPYHPSGPGETASRRKIFVCYPAAAADQEACARKIISALARRAYRHPVSVEDVSTLLSFYHGGRSNGNFDGGIQSALERILIDPDFLFRVERDPPGAKPGTVYRLSDVDLASRLSFFLWSSIPDDELLNLAVEKRLSDPAVLQKQVLRMLADPRSKALVNNFFDQWLNLRKLRLATPDPDLYPDFDENLREAFQTETGMFLESQLHEDHSVLDLLNADYTFVNERLARHYQIPNIHGNRFQRVHLSGTERGGLLGQGSILLVTSYPNRTSPVLRGKFLLELLGTPPPPPPPDVPALKDTGENGKPASVRERLEQHRRNPACASCHVRMDPLGFSLENFDVIGKWRTSSDGLPIEAAASLPDGTQFNGVSGLRELLMSRREQFVNSVISELMTYALGREVEYYDFPAVRGIAKNAAAQDYRWSAVITGIVHSVPFQMSVATAPQVAETRRAANDHK